MPSIRIKSWKNSERTNKIKPFINKCNWEGTNYLFKKDDRKIFENKNCS